MRRDCSVESGAGEDIDIPQCDRCCAEYTQPDHEDALDEAFKAWSLRAEIEKVKNLINLAPDEPRFARRWLEQRLEQLEIELAASGMTIDQ